MQKNVKNDIKYRKEIVKQYTEEITPALVRILEKCPDFAKREIDLFNELFKDVFFFISKNNTKKILKESKKYIFFIKETKLILLKR